MNHRHKILNHLHCAAILAVALTAGPVAAQVTTQNLNLVVGWNAVWLEVEPTYQVGDLPAGDTRIGQRKAPQDVFTNPRIVTVASPKVLAGLAEFFGDNPVAAGAFNQEGWEQWHRSGGIDDNLVTIAGNRPYLVEVQGGPVVLPVEGEARFFRPTWTPDRYNLIGFGIDPSAAPTFQEFFGPSGGTHPLDRIFTLNSGTGNWQVVAPGAAMVPDRAYWVFCHGNSSYMGPVAVGFDGAITGRLGFGGPDNAVTVDESANAKELDLRELVLTNLATGGPDAVPELELEAADPGQGDLRLHVVNPSVNPLGYVSGAEVDSTAGDGSSPALGESIASGTNAVLTLGAQRDWVTGTVDRTNLYRLKTGAGSEFWLPVRAVKSDLQLPGDLLPESDAGLVAGLWVGEISVEAVTTIVETESPGSPVRPVTSSAPIRIILHSDGGGAVKLLSQVTIMQTKTADLETSTAPVLVVNPARIPFFEGIKERNGKRVGLRVESVAIDMPRKLDATSQAALLNDPVYPGLTDASDITAFLTGRNIRPPSLAETYHLTWDMEGAIGTGKTVRTAAATPLYLDPFHRSNPFRHPFHQQHPRGPAISRDIAIVFDGTPGVGDRLHGTFTETISGLITETLTLTGKVTLRRISAVSTLEL